MAKTKTALKDMKFNLFVKAEDQPLNESLMNEKVWRETMNAVDKELKNQTPQEKWVVFDVHNGGYWQDDAGGFTNTDNATIFNSRTEALIRCGELAKDWHVKPINISCLNALKPGMVVKFNENFVYLCVEDKEMKCFDQTNWEHDPITLAAALGEGKAKIVFDPSKA